jgi:nucleoside-diphosphate-sugar epimerase
VRVLLTGDRGRIGVPARARLEAEGHEVPGFDASTGGDVLDLDAVRAATAGVDVVVHLAGLADDRAGPPQDVMAVNVVGTYHVLLAAEEAGVRRVVYASSGKALGLLERPPDYLPVDDAHRGLPTRPYGLSKWLAEQLCEAFTARSGIPTVCLRPVLVLDEEGWAQLGPVDELPARSPSWHLGVFVDVVDVAEAIAAGVASEHPGHVRALICADDIGSTRPTVELVAEHLSDVPWRDGEPYPQDSRRSLVDTAVAREVLGWRPRRPWPRAAAVSRA